MKNSHVCIGPYIRDLKRKYTKIKECNKSEVNNEETTNKKKEKKDVLRNLYCTNCQFIAKFNPAPNIHAMFLHYLVEHNIKIEDQIWPNISRLVKVFYIQSSGSVNFKSLIYTGDGSYNPIIKKFFKFFDHDVGTIPLPNLNDTLKKRQI